MKIPPQANEVFALFYGAPKTGKTTYCTQLCDGNFAVTVLDLENNLYPATRWKNVGNINVIPLYWQGEANRAPAVTFLTALRDAGRKPFVWDITEKRIAPATLDPEHEYVRVDLSKAAPHDVLIFDSWTVLCQQIVAGKFKTYLDMNAQVAETSQPMWGTYTNDADGGLTLLHSFRVPIKLIIGHEYSELTNNNPISVTRAHGQKLAAAFNLVARCKDGVLDMTKGGGLLPQDKKPLDKYPATMLLSNIGIKSPEVFRPSEAFVFANGDEMKSIVAATQSGASSSVSLTANRNVNVNLR